MSTKQSKISKPTLYQANTPQNRNKTLELSLHPDGRVKIVFKGINIKMTPELRNHFGRQQGVQIFEQEKEVRTGKIYHREVCLYGLICPIEVWEKEIEKFSKNPKIDFIKFHNELNELDRKMKTKDDATKIEEEMNEIVKRENEIHPFIKNVNKNNDTR